MKGKIIFHEKAVIPWFKDFSFEETKTWGQALRDKIPKVLEEILKGVPDSETFRKKIAKQIIVAVRRMLGRGFVSRQGLPKKLIIEIMKAKLTGEDAYKNYIDSVKLAYEAFDQGELNSALIAYYLGESFGEYRFRDEIEKALGWLTPFIQPAKLGGFRQKFHNQILHSGKLITDLAYHPERIKQENDIINSLINNYLKKGLVPFATAERSGVPTNVGRGASHCDFIPIPDSIRLFYSTEPKEIKYKTYKRFISEKQANNLRSLWPVIDESTRPDPNEYIGHPEKPAYFDMELDIQVSKK